MALFDFFKPHWKNSNPEIRANVLRGLEDDRQEIFLSVALEDPDAALRLIASKRLKDEAKLRQALEKSSDKGVQDNARKTLSLLLTDKIKAAGASDLTAARGWLQEINSNDKAVEDVARNAQSPELRREALASITHASSLLTIALEEEVADIALAALARLTRDTHLQSAAKSARNKETRAAAREKLKALENAKKPDATAVHRAKLQLIFSVAEKADAGSAELNPAFAWEAMLEMVEEAENALRELMEFGASPDNGQIVLFRDRVGSFRNRYSRHLAAETGRIERDREERENRDIKNEICARMEALFADAGDVNPAEVDALTRRINATGPCPEDDTLRERFRIAKERVVKGKLQKQREQEDAVRRQAFAEAEKIREEEARQKAEAWKNNAGLLKEWIEELETLAESPDLKRAEKRLREVVGRWKTLLTGAPEDEAASLNLRYYAAVDRLREVLDWHRWSNLQRKQEICGQLEAVVLTEDRKAMVARFKELMAEWKTIGQVPWENTDAVWDRFHFASDALYEKCREYFAELDEERESHAKAKEEICIRLEAVLAQEDMDWREATETFREAQSAWKAIGAVPREKNEALWGRFRAACQAFYGRKDQRSQENLKQKLELAALAERLKTSTEWKSAASQIKEAQEKWKSIGPVPKDQAEALWQRFHGASEFFFQARKAHFDKLDIERPLNLEKKTALCGLVEKLSELADDEERYQRIVDAQAQWQDIGPVPREQESALWDRFRKPIDAYFSERRERLKVERGQREENARVREDLCIEAEALRDSTDWKASIEKIKALQARWKISGQTFRELDQELWKRFRTACDAFFDRLKEHSALRDQERDINLRKKEDLCFTVEILGGLSPAEDEDREAREAWIEAQRAAGASVPEPLEDWSKGTDRVKHFQQEWKKIGPVPREKNEAVWDRFQRACDVFFDERRRAMGLPADDPQANLESKLALIAEAEELARDPGSHNEDRVGQIFRQWKRVGLVPRAQSDYVWERFSSACDAAVGRVSENRGASA